MHIIIIREKRPTTKANHSEEPPPVGSVGPGEMTIDSIRDHQTANRRGRKEGRRGDPSTRAGGGEGR